MEVCVKTIQNKIDSLSCKAFLGITNKLSDLVDKSGIKKEDGLATAEYAIVTIAAAGFAGILIIILKSGEIKEMLTNLIKTALSVK
jgi:hypothetical protein